MVSEGILYGIFGITVGDFEKKKFDNTIGFLEALC